MQKRAIHIIYPFTRDMSYSNILFVAELTSLESRRDQLSSHAFKTSVTHPSLYHLLPLHVITYICLVSAQNSHTVYTSYLTHPKILFLYQLRLKLLPGTTP